MMVGIDKDDFDKRFEKMQPILQDLRTRGADPKMQTNPVARMRAIVNHLKVFVSILVVLVTEITLKAAMHRLVMPLCALT
jgi:hypothetical protein